MKDNLIFRNIDKDLEQIAEECLQGKEVVVSKFGNAKIHNGYYEITSHIEGNRKKLLHRLMWEKYYGKPIPDGYVIHHINGDKLDNRIQNLQCVERGLHMRFHTQNRSDDTLKKMSESKMGEKNPMYGQIPWNKGKTDVYSKETLQKMSENISKAKNKTGYYRVSIHKRKDNKQGSTYEYRYYDENGKPKTISSVSIEKLEEKVKAKGLEWYKF